MLLSLFAPFLVILVILVGLALGLGLLLNWLFPAVDLGIGILIGLLATAMSIHFGARLIGFLPFVPEEALEEYEEIEREAARPAAARRRRRQ